MLSTDDKLLAELRGGDMIVWEFPNALEVFAIGWTGGECRFEISRTAVKTKEGFTYTYGLWSTDSSAALPAGDMVNLATSPWPTALIRIAESLAEREAEAAEDGSELIDKTDAEWSN